MIAGMVRIPLSVDGAQKSAKWLATAKLDERIGFGGSLTWPDNDALVKLLNHSDCDGKLKWRDCEAIADRLTDLLPALQVAGSYYAVKAQRFIDGLRLAATKKENVIFH